METATQQPRADSPTAAGAGTVYEQRHGTLSTLNDDGSRKWLQPRPSRGKWWTKRRAVAYGLILLFTAVPYIRVNGLPLVLLDITARRFTLFGYTFLPTDTPLFVLLMVAVFLAVFLATSILGRVWCGWACPQTVYMEFLYRPIERLFEGGAGQSEAGGGRAAGAEVGGVRAGIAVFGAHVPGVLRGGGPAAGVGDAVAV